MRSLAVVAALLVSCSLLTPFELRNLGAADAAGDSDADGDGSVDAAGDVEHDGDATDADVEPWEPLAGCTRDVTEERWLVAVWQDAAIRGLVTDRDCANPVELCSDCVPVGISPSGKRALVLRPTADLWRLEDEIALIDLDEEEPRIQPLGVQGALPAWADDETFFFVAARSLDGPCDVTGGQVEMTELRRFDMLTKTHAPVGDEVRRAWRNGFPVPSDVTDATPRVAFGFEGSNKCEHFSLAITIRDVGTGRDKVLGWTVENKHDFPVGRLPDGSGFLVQHGVSFAVGESKIYAVHFDGRSESLLDSVDSGLSYSLLADVALAEWPDCGTVRRLGPACELYCRETGTGSWLRHDLLSEVATPVECGFPHDTMRIMDVWQR